jgi:hypothetical protein
LAVAGEDLSIGELCRKSLSEGRDLFPLQTSIDEFLILKLKIIFKNILDTKGIQGTRIFSPRVGKEIREEAFKLII